jgi:hypothetical protein
MAALISMPVSMTMGLSKFMNQLRHLRVCQPISAAMVEWTQTWLSDPAWADPAGTP